MRVWLYYAVQEDEDEKLYRFLDGVSLERGRVVTPSGEEDEDSFLRRKAHQFRDFDLTSYETVLAIPESGRFWVLEEFIEKTSGGFWSISPLSTSLAIRDEACDNEVQAGYSLVRVDVPVSRIEASRKGNLLLWYCEALDRETAVLTAVTTEDGFPILLRKREGEGKDSKLYRLPTKEELDSFLPEKHLAEAENSAAFGGNFFEAVFCRESHIRLDQIIDRNVFFVEELSLSVMESWIVASQESPFSYSHAEVKSFLRRHRESAPIRSVRLPREALSQALLREGKVLLPRVRSERKPRRPL